MPLPLLGGGWEGVFHASFVPVSYPHLALPTEPSC